MADASSWYQDYFFFLAGFFAAFFVAMSTPPPFDVKMVIVYVLYSRVCGVSKIVSPQFFPHGGNRGATWTSQTFADTVKPVLTGFKRVRTDTAQGEKWGPSEFLGARRSSARRTIFLLPFRPRDHATWKQ